ncbi:MAG: DUF4843 domain-containing protein [Candidatus Pseudobacter hemicellulosilyticus]|uniref:DUF4843 domain-containing protein n=1 Tax=Candidatus Pseudobacter hemicellulosilyticus TaxID=3121375 RepID=A0AAJ6BFG1_9BACT|nr:MAG: DUF4843 domain-containing protein [Pseudobacter sp.]
MKKQFFSIYLALAATLLLTACEKDLPVYQTQPGLYFYEYTTGVAPAKIFLRSFTFLGTPSSVTKDTLNIRVKIMGETTAYDRVVKGKTVAKGSTAVEGLHYDFIEGAISADSIYGYLPVVLYRTADIATQSVFLNLAIDSTKDFRTGAVEDQQFSLEWSDKVVKPDNWETLIGLKTYFGTYSDTKFKFIIDVTGIASFPLWQNSRVAPLPGEYTPAAMQDITRKIKAALVEYNASHTPALTDESGQVVVFP